MKKLMTTIFGLAIGDAGLLHGVARGEHSPLA